MINVASSVKSFEPWHNKQFKRDSQRLAFWVLLQIKCLRHNALGFGGSVAHPLIGRYAFEYPTFSRHFIKLELGSI